MKISLSWLKQYIEVKLSPPQIAKILTMAGLEVDSIQQAVIGFDKVVVGKVVSVEKHPNADKLCVATVSDGGQSYQVVCGAPNCRPGIKTALALVGATLTEKDGKKCKVKQSKLRGVESFGMLCSSSELGLSEDHDGIVEFAEHIKEGTDVAEMYADAIFEISLTPNLGHCSSVIGVARELSAATGEKLRFPETNVNEDLENIASDTKVSILDPERCPRYACRLIKDVRVGPSPEWLQKQLIASGLRPINNIVDVTNFVLLEMGHPLHAFDFDKLEGKEIIVRTAKAGESFTTLDGKERVLTATDLLICDRTKAVAIAGVMGGQNSEVSETTQNVLLEAAYFLPSAIRKTSKRLGLSTDASKRFERGCDPNALPFVLDRAAALIQQTAGGKVCSGIIDAAHAQFPDKHIKCRLSRVNSLLGILLSVSEVEAIFHKLGLHTHWDGQDTFSVRVPTYRVDLENEIDLIEEVARLYGYDNFLKTANPYHASPLPHTPIYLFEKEIRSRLIGEGLQEVLTCDLIGPSLMDIVRDTVMPQESLIKVLNPTSLEQSILRTSLLPGLLQIVKYNWDRQNQNIHAFEIGRVHFKENDQYIEQPVMGIVLSGKRNPHHWDIKPSEDDFFDLKGIIEDLLSELKIEQASFRKNSLDIFHPGRQAAIYCGELEIGSLGEVHPAILRRLDVPQPIFFAELSLPDLYKVRQQNQKFQEIPIYPGSERDWTIALAEAIPIADVLAMIRTMPSQFLENVTLKDVYRSEKIGKDVKNVTFHFMYRDRKKTVEQENVDAEHARLTDEVANKLKNRS